jgi:hypothetical protein
MALYYCFPGEILSYSHLIFAPSIAKIVIASHKEMQVYMFL